MNLLGTKLLRKNHKKIRHLPYFLGNSENFFRKNEENVGVPLRFPNMRKQYDKQRREII